MIQFKRGDTFLIEGIEVIDEDKNPVDISGVDIKCQARTGSGVVAIDFTVIRDSDSEYSLDAGDTSQCPVGLLRSDIQYTEDGVISSTATFTIACIQDQTYVNN